MSIPILMYHRVTKKGDSIYSLGKNKFEKQLQLISQKEYRTIKVEEIENIKSEEKIIILTFDDGDKSWVDNVLPLLKKYNFKATFFVTAGLLNKEGFLSEDDLIKLKENNMEIGIHGFSHYPLNKLGDEELKFELEFSKKYIERIIREEVKSFSFPNGVYNRKIINLGKKFGYKYFCSSNPGYVNGSLFLIPRFIIRRNTTDEQFLKILNSNIGYFIKEKSLYYTVRISKKLISLNLYESIKKALV